MGRHRHPARRLLLTVGILAGALPAAGEDSLPQVSTPFVQTLDVIATSQADAWDVPRDQVPANVQSVGTADLRRGRRLETGPTDVQLEEP